MQDCLSREKRGQAKRCKQLFTPETPKWKQLFTPPFLNKRKETPESLNLKGFDFFLKQYRFWHELCAISVGN